MVTDDDVALIDPSRNLVLTPGNDVHPAVGHVLDACAQVRSRIVTERLTVSFGDTRQPLPLIPSVAVLHPGAEPELRRRMKTVVGCLELLIQRYRYLSELQDFLNVPPVLHEWVMRHPDPHRLRIDLCRLDLLGSTLNSVRVLEFNASSPGGIIMSGMINRFWRESSLRVVLDDWDVPAAPFERPYWFADWLVRYGHERGVGNEIQHVGLFHSRVSTKHESHQMSAQLRDRGYTAVESEPTDTDVLRRLRLGYLKHIPVDPLEVQRWEAFCTRVTSGELVIPNALAQRWIAENKLCLAALSDPRFRGIFTPVQRAALNALVPFSRKLGDGISEDETIARRRNLVLKKPYSCRGESVVVGAYTNTDKWRETVRTPEHRGWLVQEYIPPSAVETEQGSYSWDLIVPVLERQVVGYGSRVGRGHLLNCARGGGARAIFGPHPLEQPRTETSQGIDDS